MLENFNAELNALLAVSLSILGGLIAVYLHTVVIPRYKKSDFYQRYGAVLGALDAVVTNIVLQIAFAPGDLTQFEEEAQRTGRDVRLVAAMYLVNRWTNSLGIELDEELIVSTIEAKLAELKQTGYIPSNNNQTDEAA